MSDDGTITWRALLAETAARLRHSDAIGDNSSATVEARWLCEAASGMGGAEWVLGQGAPAGTRGVARLDAMVARRLAGEPIQYVLGSWPFRHLELMVDRRVLIPRPETELVVDAALALITEMPAPRTIVDLGTGSGAIALSLAAELPIATATVWAVDASTDALDVARANLAGLGRHGTAVRIVAGDWFDALPDELRGTVDLVVSNPPYVASGDVLDDSVRDYEPRSALYGGVDGLDAIRVIVGGAPSWLRRGGWLVVEIGASQGSLVRAALDAAGLVDVDVRADLAGRDRIAQARRP